MKPILFNTEMVCAILDNRKTVTRRVVRGINNSADFLTLIDNPSVIAVDKHGQEYPKDVKGLYANFVHDGDPEYPLVKAPYRTGDILYVQETWNRMLGDWIYKADQKLGMKNPGKWRPSIYMPREAARIFLRVTDVQVERLWDITEEPLEVLSMYDGMICGHLALDKLGAHIDHYYTTEIDKYAIQTTQRNFPDTIQLGDAFQVREEGWSVPEQ